MKIVQIVINAYVKEDSEVEDTIDDMDIEISHPDVVSFQVMSANEVVPEDVDGSGAVTTN